MNMTRNLRMAGLFPLSLWLCLTPILLCPQQGPPPPAAPGSDRPPDPLNVPRVEGGIVVDGRLEEAAWEQALVLDLPFETEPGENIPAPVQTTLRVFHDKENIYFGMECLDPDPSRIRSRFAERDSFDGHDLINVNLDTFNDERRNYFFGCNPLGVQRDGLETTGADMSWDAIWASAGRIHERGYTIEIAIPFSSLQFQRTAGPQVWGLDVSRWYPRSQRHRLGLVRLDRSNNSYQSQFLKIRGFAGIKPGKRIEAVPTLTGLNTDARQELPDGDFANATRRLDPGLTVKWGVTANLTINGTVNPDFSQVEADSRQLDINQPFALFYREKRPFFTEGADFFSSPFNVIYTRTLRDPRWGVKLAGKEGSNSFGAFFVQDDLTNLIFPGSQGSQSISLDALSSALVLRYKRDLGSRYTLGALFTGRSGDDPEDPGGGGYFNRVYGFDGEARFTRRDKVSFQFLGSSTRYPDAVASGFSQSLGTLNDRAFGMQYQHQSRSFNWYLEYDEAGPRFRADLGFMPRVGYREIEGGFSHCWNRNQGWWSQIRLGTSYERSEDHQGRFLYEMNSLNFVFRGALQSNFMLYGYRIREDYQGRIFPKWAAEAYLEMQPSAVVWLAFYGNLGDQVDYENVRPGWQVQANPALQLNISRRLVFRLDHNYQRMSVGGRELYTANITQGSAIYHLSARTFFRAIVQYVDYRYNAANYTFAIDPVYKHLFSQLLFSYRLNPRTVLFLGYSDNALGSQEYRLARSDRTVFMKVSYSWQI
jgi:hypothetical protein